MRWPDPAGHPSRPPGCESERAVGHGTHPLEPLSADEFRRTTEILRRDGHVTDTFRFASIELMEPRQAGGVGLATSVTRAAALVRGGVEPLGQQDLRSDRRPDRRLPSLSFKHIPDVTPNFTVDEFHEVDEALRKHPDVIAKLRERGFTDTSLRHRRRLDLRQGADAREVPDRRLGWCDLWVRETPDGNPYAHPVSGLKVLVDMNTLELLEIEDQYDVGMPAVDGEYVPGLRGREASAPI